VLAVARRRLKLVPIEKLLQQPLALNLGNSAQVKAVEVEQVEGVVLDAALPAAGKRRLELGKVCAAVLDDCRLAVYDGLTGNIESPGDPREALGPIEAVAGIDGSSPVVGVQAVVLYLVEPPVARGSLRLERGELRLDESRHSRRLRAFGRDAGRLRALGH
jgi:hypothetical protein